MASQIINKLYVKSSYVLCCQRWNPCYYEDEEEEDHMAGREPNDRQYEKRRTQMWLEAVLDAQRMFERKNCMLKGDRAPTPTDKMAKEILYPGTYGKILITKMLIKNLLSVLFSARSQNTGNNLTPIPEQDENIRSRSTSLSSSRRSSRLSPLPISNSTISLNGQITSSSMSTDSSQTSRRTSTTLTPFYPNDQQRRNSNTKIMINDVAIAQPTPVEIH